ncbi:MAG: hypothetical protein JWP61_2805 [Friedmanniella sp.]|nr:hypothetical protein [Friedmanniella sp.]
MTLHRQHPRSWRLARRTALVALATGLLLGPAVTTSAAPAAPSPSVTPSPTATSPTASSPTVTPGGDQSAVSATPALSATPTSPTPTAAAPTPAGRPQAAADAATLSLDVQPVDGPVPAFYQDLGAYGISGTSSGLPDGAPVEVYRRTGDGPWAVVAQTQVVAAAYAVRLPVQAQGSMTFQATTGGPPGAGDAVQSPALTVLVADSSVTLDRPAGTVDSLVSPLITGSVVPARAGVEVHLDVRVGAVFRLSRTTVTDAAGRWSSPFSHGRGHLAGYTLRATYHAANRDRWEASASQTLRRIAVLNAVITPTTAAEVAKTYRAGCPVGRSRLSTITMNFYGRDKLMHRGVLIIRSDRTGTITRSFGKALARRYPIAKLDNPNVYGGNDPRQMAANNTSGFNCRKVVGNPYAQSPHSYGIAIDVNTVQNPYRDARGRWWPGNGTSYIDRSPLRWGMLAKGSTLTAALRSEHYFWGGLWSPGRDYQHFERR